MKLNILDQSPVFTGKSYTQAINETIELAKFADKNNFHRFWLAEHHNTKSFASASPEILSSALGFVTKKIRIGAGGVLLTHYSPLKVAEQFKMLESLYPGRIDLGLGRAGGTDARTNYKLNSIPTDVFGKIDELLTYFNQKESESKIASPLIEDAPEIWILGTSVDSAMYAASRGLRYSFANFISDEQCIQALTAYYQNFKPSIYLKEPYINLAVFCMTSETEQKALDIVKPVEVWAVNSMLYGKNENFPTEEEARSHTFSMQEKLLVDFKRKSAYVGDIKTVAERLMEAKKTLAVHEFTLISICERPDDKICSYKLLSDYFLKQ